MAQITQKDLQRQESSAQDSNARHIAQIVQNYNHNQRIGRQYLRFAIEDLTRNYCGRIQVLDPRKAKTLPLLKAFYKARVESRCREYTDINEDIFNIIARFLTNKNSRIGLLLNGWTGTGKTTMALAMYDTIKAMHAYEISATDLATHLTIKWVKASALGAISKNNPNEFENIKKAKVLFIDDIGFNGECDVVNDFGTKRRPFEEVLEYRYDNQLLTIATSNLPIESENGNDTDTFLSRYGRRIASRMLEMFAELQLGNKDFRTNEK